MRPVSSVLESESCPVCGALVKKDNLRAHYQKAHPRKVRSLSSPRPVTAASSGSVFPSHRRRNVLILTLIVLVTIGVSVAASQFVKSNTVLMHIHLQLSITSNSLGAMTIPSQIGIAQSLWKDHSLDQYGADGLSPIHTHNTSGQIHVESNTARNFTLQEFLAIWGQASDGSKINDQQVISLTVDGQTEASTQEVVFKDLQKIVMVTS